MKLSALVALFLFAGAQALADDDKLHPAAPPDYPQRDSTAASIYRGAIVFHRYCALCHGAQADGNGRAAKLHTPPPANLVMSDKNDDYKSLIIRRGGKMLGRSEFMPSWENELTDQQIADVVAFLRSIRSPAVTVY